MKGELFGVGNSGMNVAQSVFFLLKNLTVQFDQKTGCKI